MALEFFRRFRFSAGLFLRLASILMFVVAANNALAERTVDSATLNGGSSVTVAPGASITAVVNVTTDWWMFGDNNWRSTGWFISSSPPGSVTCVNHANHDSTGTYSETFSVTAPSTPGTYNIYFIAYSDNGCSAGASATYTLTASVIVTSGGGGGGGGCTSSTIGVDTVVTCTGNGTFTPPVGVTSVNYLIVGGGGGGGGLPNGGNLGGGGGGGAGGVLQGTGFVVTPATAYAITVGDGGAGGVGGISQGGNGGSSSFSTLTAVGGGGGASNSVSNDGNNGASGGGGRIDGNGGTAVAGQGYAGGDGNASGGSGGGGGAGGAGANGSGSTAGGTGGAGITNNISGASVTYARGGEGGSYNNTGSRSPGTAGTANTGNGGSGADGNNGGGAVNGGAGGSGIVILRYTPASGFDHLRIEHSGSGVTCAPTTLTIKACADAACGSLYTAGVTGTMSATGAATVNWIGGANFSIGLAGFVTKDVHVTTPGTVTWGTSLLAPVATNGTGCYVGATASCNFTAALGGFLFDVPHHVADSTQTLTVSAVKQSNSSLSCIPTFISTSKTIQFSCGYGNPTTGTLPIVIGGSNVACGGSSTGVSLAFNASGVASTTLRYADVGLMSLTASYTGTSGSEAGLVMTGTDTFITAPANFSLTTGGPFVAGVDFSTTVTARNASGNATPNFGRETAPAGATLSFSRCQPTGTGTSAGLYSGGTLGAFSGGAASASNLNWSEVGNGDVSAVLTGGNYLGSGLTATGNSGAGGTVCNGAGNVGPFRPHHFDTTVTHGCVAGGFTYSAQPFTVTVTAKNGLATPTTTVNYSGTTTPAFAKVVTLSDANGAVGSWANNVIPVSGFSSGVASATPSFSFTAQPGGPAVLKPRATDTDAVSSSLGSEGTTALRHGRLRISNAFGPASGSLSMPVQAQYWSGSSWVLNGDDSCTTLSANAFFLTGGPAATTTASALSLASGVGTLILTKSTTVTGSVDVAANLGTAGSDQSCLATHGGTAANRPWLRSRNGSCAATYDRDPAARATFGIYAPETRRTVHVREQF